MAQLVILTGDTSGRKRWGLDRGKAQNWFYTTYFEDAILALEEGRNVVLDNDLLTGHDVHIKHVKIEKEYKPYSKEEEN